MGAGRAGKVIGGGYDALHGILLLQWLLGLEGDVGAGEEGEGRGEGHAQGDGEGDAI